MNVKIVGYDSFSYADKTTGELKKAFNVHYISPIDNDGKNFSGGSSCATQFLALNDNTNNLFSRLKAHDFSKSLIEAKIVMSNIRDGKSYVQGFEF